MGVDGVAAAVVGLGALAQRRRRPARAETAFDVGSGQAVQGEEARQALVHARVRRVVQPLAVPPEASADVGIAVNHILNPARHGSVPRDAFIENTPVASVGTGHVE